jgi:hypothetical protein
MPSAYISNVDLETPLHVWKGQPITGKEMQLDFTVRVSNDGCYAIAIEIYDYHLWRPNTVIASNLNHSTLDCTCLKKGEAYVFHATGDSGAADPAPAGSTPVPNPIHGSWPESSGPFSDTMNLFAKIDVYYCRRACPPQGGSCGRISVHRLDVLCGTVENDDERRKVKIVDSPEPMNSIEKAAGAGMSAGSKALPGGATGGVLKSELPGIPPELPGTGPELAGSQAPEVASLALKIDEMRAEISRLRRGQAFPAAEGEE